MAMGIVSAQAGRNTYSVDVGTLRLIFSYDTCIAVRGPDGHFRDSTNYSRTTNKHHRLYGTDSWPCLDREDFEKFVERSLVAAGMAVVTDALTQENVK